MTIIPAARDLIKSFESLQLKAYQCPAGVWTIGYGSTRNVHPGLTITELGAESRLEQDIADAGTKLAAVVDESVLLSLGPHQYGALVSFVFNLGANKSWTIWKLINQRKFDAVPAQLLRFCYAGGKKLAGLERRRQAEAALWKQDDLIENPAAEQIPSSGALREMPTPPAPAADAKPLAQSKTIWAGAATTAAGAIEVVKQIQGTVGAEQANSPLLQGLYSNMAVVIVALGVAVMAIRWIDERAKRR